MGDWNSVLAILSAGAVPTDDEWSSITDAIDALTSAMVPYVPSWTGAVTNPVLGNGFLQGGYTRGAKLGLGYFTLVVGSTTTFGSGAWSFGLPTGWVSTAFVQNRIAGPGFARDNSGATHVALELSLAASGSAMDMRAQGGNQVSSTVPFTFAVSDYIHGVYQIELA